MSDLSLLIDRVTKLTGPDRETDARIWCLLNPGTLYKGHYPAYNEPRLTQVEYTTPPKRTRLVSNGRHEPHAADWTASLDAVVALIERVLPSDKNADHKKSEIIIKIGDFGCHASVNRDTFDGGMTSHGSATTAPLALLLALLRSMEADQ